MTRALLSIVAALLLAAATLVGLAATTQPGLRWLFAAVARVVPGQLSAADIRGTLLQPMRIDGLRYAHKGTVTEMKHLELAWRPGELWHRTLYLTTIKIQDLHVRHTSQPGPTKVPTLALPLRVVLADVEVGNAVLQRSGSAKPVVIKRARLAARLDENRLSISRFSVDGKRFSLSVSGTITPRGDYPLGLQMHWVVNPGGKIPPLSGKGELSGSLMHLEVRQSLQSPSAARLDLTMDNPLTAPEWRAALELPPVSARTFNPGWPAMDLSAGLQASGGRQRFKATADYHLHTTAAGNLGGRIRVSGDMNGKLQIGRFSLEGKGGNRLRVTLSGSADLPTQTLSVKGHWQHLAWPPAGPPKAHSPKGEFTLDGTPARYRFNAGGGLVLSQRPPIDWQLRGTGNRQGVQLSSAQAGLLGGTVRSAGSLSWADGLRFDLKGGWQGLNWTPAGRNAVRSAQGDYALQGTPDDYTLNVSTSLAGKDIPTVHLALQGEGSRKALQIKTLGADLLGGQVRGEGHVDWAPGISWELALGASGINPGVRWTGWPGRIGLQARTAGRIEDGLPHGSFELVKLDGTLREYPVSGSARVGIEGGRYTVERLELHSGRSVLAAKGQVGEELALEWTLASPDLRELLPTASGSVKAKGTLHGPRHTPDITASLSARTPAYGPLHARSVDAQLKLAMAGDGAFSGTLEASGLNYGGKTLGDLSMQSTGTAASHRIRVSLQGPGPKLSLQAEGTLAQGSWTGRLVASELDARPYGRWSQLHAVDMKLSGSALALGRACWRREQAELCLGGDWTRGGTWHVQTSLADLPDAWAGEWLALPAVLHGTLQGQASASGSGRTVNEAHAHFTTSAGTIEFTPNAGGAPATVKLGESKATLEADGKATTAALDVQFTAPARSPVRASLRLPPLRLDRSYLLHAAVKGEVSATLNNLQVIEAFAPDLADVSGSADAALQIGGTLANPRLSGQVIVDNAAAQVPRLGLSLKDIRLQAAGAEDQIRLTGTASSGPGKVALDGHVRLDAGQGWPLELSLKGDRFEAANIPEAWVLASPDLKITAAHHAVNVTGAVTIPEAKLQPRQIVAAVPVSQDVVIVSGNQVKKQTPRWKITSNVRITLGDKVSLKGFGFSGRITGSVVAHDSPGKPTTGSGTLTIQDGSYTAYGQKLEINSGRVLFAGGPITDPGLDLSAVRKLTDVTAGVRVQGRVSSPQLTLFSDPTMSQDNILSYLILGQPLDQASGNQGQLLAQAASSLALQGGNLLSKRIGQTFGLSNVGIESSGTPQSASLVIGKYLSPRLYVSYGMGLFQTLNTVRMRYKIGRHWSVEAETGTATGADILYSRER